MTLWMFLESLSSWLFQVTDEFMTKINPPSKPEQGNKTEEEPHQSFLYRKYKGAISLFRSSPCFLSSVDTLT